MELGKFVANGHTAVECLEKMEASLKTIDSAIDFKVEIQAICDKIIATIEST